MSKVYTHTSDRTSTRQAHSDLVKVMNRILAWDDGELPPVLRRDAEDVLKQTGDCHPEQIIEELT